MTPNEIRDAIEAYMIKKYGVAVGFWQTQGDGIQTCLFANDDFSYQVIAGDNGKFGIYQYIDAKQVTPNGVEDQKF